jgi:methyl-accepting chemotaxis protein
MKLHTISIRSRLLVAGLIIILFWAVMALFYTDGLDRLKEQEALLEKRTGLLEGYATAVLSCAGISSTGDRPGGAGCAENLLQLEDLAGDLASFRPVAADDEARALLRQILILVEETGRMVRSGTAGDPDGSQPELKLQMELLSARVSELDRRLDELQSEHRRTGNRRLGTVLLVGIVLTGGWFFLFSRNLARGFRKLAAFTGRLNEGSLPSFTGEITGDEFGRVAADLNEHSGDLRQKIQYITSLADDTHRAIYAPHENDELGSALVVLSDYLTRKELDEVTRKRDDKRQNWISEGFAQMGEVLRSERENVTDLSFRIIQQLVRYMNVEMGSIFLTGTGDPGKPTLELAAVYAYDRRKYLKQSLDWGEGLPGACAREKDRIFLTDVPSDYFDIISGAGDTKPNCILLVPLKIADEVHGVIELATVRLIKPFEIEFVESLSESISSSLIAVRNSETTAGLLRQSQAQAETLKQQEAAMMENMKKLEQAQEDSRRRETEFSGILQAINQSSPVAELGLNGRFSSVNEKFLQLLESHRDQVLGKQYSEFAQVDAYSDLYKQFWADLREGKSVSNVATYKLFSGKEIWLQQTFTPIINNEGKVYKILNIAEDITENHNLREKLQTREMEIMRSHLDLQTLNEAVNASLIKCELDGDGIIMEVNENYVGVTGYGRKELLGRNYRLFLKDTEKDQFEKIWEEVKKEKVYEGVMRRSRPTGEEVWLASTLSPVKDESGTIYKVYFLGLDISEKKLKYQLLEDANREIERLRLQLMDDGRKA